MTSRSAERALWLAAVLVAFGAYAQTAGFQFVYDDVHIVQDNTLVHSLANWKQIVRATWWGQALYRPLTELSFALDWTVSGGDPRWFHLVNVLLHAAATGLVYPLARGGLGPIGAGAAALLFAVHPVHVEAVANVVGRAELLAALWALLAALSYRADGRLAFQADRSWRRAVTSFGTLLAALLALASKESAFALPGILLLVDWLEAQQTGTGLARRFGAHWVLWAGTVALSLEWLWVRTLVLGDLAGDHPAPGLEGQGFAGRMWIMAPVVLQYARLLFFPARLSADYSPNYLPVVPALTPAGAAGLLLAAGATIVALRGRSRAPVLAFAIAWMAGTLLVVSNLIVPSGVLLAERTLYLPSVGAVLALAWLVAWSEASWPRTGVALTALAVGLGLARTASRSSVWSDNQRFFPQLVRDAPGSYRSFWVASGLAYGAGDRARGEALARRAITIYPYQPALWEGLAHQLEREGRWLEAARHYRAAYLLADTVATYAMLSARSYLRAGMMDSALALVQHAGKLTPSHPAYLSARAEIARAQRRYLEALTWRRQVAWANPDIWQYWVLTAQAAIEAEQCWEARRSVARVRQLRPDLPRLAELERELQRVGCAP